MQVFTQAAWCNGNLVRTVLNPLRQTVVMRAPLKENGEYHISVM